MNTVFFGLGMIFAPGLSSRSLANQGFAFHWDIQTTEIQALPGKNKTYSNNYADGDAFTFKGIKGIDWSCESWNSPSKVITGGLGKFISESFDFKCWANSNPEYFVTESISCSKYITGPTANEPMENSGGSVTLRSPSTTLVVSATCSEQTWRSQSHPSQYNKREPRPKK